MRCAEAYGHEKFTYMRERRVWHRAECGDAWWISRSNESCSTSSLAHVHVKPRLDMALTRGWYWRHWGQLPACLASLGRRYHCCVHVDAKYFWKHTGPDRSRRHMSIVSQQTGTLKAYRTLSRHRRLLGIWRGTICCSKLYRNTDETKHNARVYEQTTRQRQPKYLDNGACWHEHGEYTRCMW